MLIKLTDRYPDLSFADAIQKAIDDPEISGVQLERGEHVTPQTIELKRAFALIGETGGGLNQRSWVVTNKQDVTPIRITGSHARVESLGIRVPGSGDPLRDQVCLEIMARCTVRHVGCLNGRHGVRIIGRKGDGNANMVGLEDVTTSSTAHAGVFVHGQDSNVGDFRRVHVVHSCRYANRYLEAAALNPTNAELQLLRYAAAVLEASTLGNGWSLLNASGAVDEKGAVYPCFLTPNANARPGTFVCYSEEGITGVGSVGANGMHLGGKMAISGSQGFVISGRRLFGAIASRLVLRPGGDRDAFLVFEHPAHGSKTFELGVIKNAIRGWFAGMDSMRAFTWQTNAFTHKDPVTSKTTSLQESEEP